MEATEKWLEQLRDGWLVDLKGDSTGWELRISRPGAPGGLLYTGQRLTIVVARAWAGEPADGDWL